ncbi:MAG: 50S ribosomal protein L4 [uncultured bacterium]|nr:MAG: 50S ribosomal protein L4 [uncultured bacterium]
MALNVKIFNNEGKVVGEQVLNPKVFGVKVKTDVVHQVVVSQAANVREAIAHTKTKGEVRGGGRKPWKQKGTGRARQGSTRNPQWRGGGVVFGPRSNRNFSQKVNKKMKRLALAMALSDKVANEKLLVVDSISVPAGKTKQLQNLFIQLPCKSAARLLALGAYDSNVIRAAQNAAATGYCAADSLNVIDVLKYDYLVLDKAAITIIEQTFGK